MVHIRTELKKGITVLILLLLVVLITETFSPDPIQTSEYVQVSSIRVRDNPSLYEGKKITITINVISVEVFDAQHNQISSTESIMCLYPNNFETVQSGERLIIRGICRIESLGYVEVTDTYSIDILSSPIRSIPGIILFAILLFYVYRFEVREFVFLPRRTEHA